MLRRSLFLTLLVAIPLSAEETKLDTGIDKESAKYPIFVRMKGQLLAKAGDYEAFCAKHADAKRTQLRPKILKILKDNSATSWKAIEKEVAKLEKSGDLEDVTRFWIVNGFACQATGKACTELAKSETVEFVYMQRGPIRQHRLPMIRNAQPRDQLEKVYAKVLGDWKDDSGTPLDLDGVEIPWNVKKISADRVWTELKSTGKGVTVALLDSGLMVTPSLVQALWKNPNEKLDGKDNDGNGYIDDLFGYDFMANSFHALGDNARLPHGSMCGGILAGRPLNSKKLMTGIAPRAKLMVLRGMGYLKAYEYAAENGADIMSMSYMWVNRELGNYRGVYRTAHEHLSALGIVSVGGAGNFARRAPAGKQIALPKDIPCVIAAAGVVQNGNKAPASSQGPVYWDDVKFYSDYPKAKPLAKPDVTGYFGGYPVWARPRKLTPRWKIVSDEGNSIGLVIGPQGNSFSGPHAGGVVALMLSANPDLTAWKAKEILEKTCKDIGEKGRDPIFGAGLLQAYEAVKAAKK